MTDRHLTLSDLLLACDFGRADPARMRALIEAELSQYDRVTLPVRTRTAEDEEFAEAG